MSSIKETQTLLACNEINLQQQLKQLSLSTFVRNYIDYAVDHERHGSSYVHYLNTLVQAELEHRQQQRIEKLLKASELPRNKHLADFEISRIEGLSPTLINNLASGDFIDRCENIIIFGNPGTGKTHLSVSLGREWCLLGRKVLYSSVSNLVQKLLVAKEELRLSQFLKKLDQYEILIIDDISYIPFEHRESGVLFQLIAARYETRSLVITSNLAFKNWSSFFKDEITANAAIDRLIHHSVILELNAKSYRMSQATAVKYDNIIIRSGENNISVEQESNGSESRGGEKVMNSNKVQ